MFHTTDLGLAAALMSVGIKIVKVDTTNRKAVFIFNNNSDTTIAELDYMNDKLKVEPRKYMDVLRTLKTKIYNVNN